MTERYDSGLFMNDDFPFALLRMVHNRSNTPRRHSHDFIELVYVERGSAVHLFEGEAYRIESGDVFIINPGESHTFQIQADEELEIINCLFQPHLIQESILRELAGSDMMDYFYIHPFLDPSERFNHTLRLQGQEAHRVQSQLVIMEQELKGHAMGYQTVIRMRLMELLLLLSRYYHGLGGRLRQSTAIQRKTLAQRINGYLERHYQQKITQSMLSSVFNLSVRQLNRIAREELGTSIVERIQQIRIERAKLILKHMDVKVITVSSMVGYEDPAFFSHLFTREVGCSPGRYRDSVHRHAEAMEDLRSVTLQSNVGEGEDQ